jgi:hypothetical protein
MLAMTDPADYACRWNALSCKARVSEQTARLRAALALIATPPRPDGTWNRDRQACYELAREALEQA